MKKLFILTAVLTLYSTVYSQINFKTGSSSIDDNLNIINNKANLDISNFKTEMNATFGVPIKEIETMLGTKDVVPGDVYFTLELAKSTKKTAKEVFDIFLPLNGNLGWAIVLSKLGFRLNTKEYHDFQDIVKNYALKLK